MKTIHLLAVVIALIAANPVWGQEILQNSDFSDGTNGWHGDVKPAASESSTDLVTGQDSSKGIAVELRSSKQSYFEQKLEDLKVAPNTGVDLTVEYRASSDFAIKGQQIPTGSPGGTTTIRNVRGGVEVELRTRPPIETQTQGIGLNGLPLVVTNPDLVSSAGFVPTADGASHTFTYTMWLPPPTNSNPVIVHVSVPPGAGTLFFTKISMTMHAGPVQPQQGQMNMFRNYPGAFPQHSPMYPSPNPNNNPNGSN